MWRYVGRDGDVVVVENDQGRRIEINTKDEVVNGNTVGMSTGEAHDALEALDEGLEAAGGGAASKPAKLLLKFFNKAGVADDIPQDAVGPVWWWKNRSAFEIEQMDKEVNTNFDSALKTASPMVLDLDGDGIETYGAEGQTLFDHDGDGNKHGSGWVKPDDGLLVLDRNHNGSIDNGHELFGENTLLADGTKAKDGFAAMQAVDGNADGKLDANDAVWGDLRVWRDLNGDGISQSGELFTLQDLGIESIATGSDGKKQALGNDNHIDGFGTFKWDAAHGGGNGVSGDVYFENNPFYREFADSIEIPANLAGVADMRGAGAVRDLREAAASSNSLSNALATYSQADTRVGQQVLLDQLVRAWADSASFRTFDERISDLAEGKTYKIEFDYSWEVKKKGFAAGSSSGGSNVSGGTNGIPVGTGQDTSPTADQLRKKELLEMVRVLEVFNGQYFFDFKPVTDDDKDGKINLSYVAGVQSRSGSAGGSLAFGSTFYLTEEDFSFGPNQEKHIRAAYQALLDSVYNGLLLQTRLKPYLDAVSLVLTQDTLTLDFTAALDKFAQTHAHSPVKAIVDVLEFGSAIAGTAGWAANEIAIAGDWVRQLDAAQVEALKAQLGAASNVVFDTIANSNLIGGSGSDFLFGEAGNDTLTGNDGADFLDGGDGNDRLYGNSGNDLLLAGAGNDSLYGGDGNDVLDGGAGNDALSGEGGSDTYRFARGWGQDSINNNDASTGKVDAIEFGAGITASDIVATRSGTNLILSLVGSTDRITVTNYFNADGTSSYKLEEIRFIDGSVWDIAKVKELALLNTAGNDTLTGYATADVLNGGAGNDSLYGGAGDDQLLGELGDDRLYGEDGNDLLQGAEGNDTLYGGEGNDVVYGGEGVDNLFGGNGNDILEGGASNDNLSGEGGSDTYRFARGWGQDSINNNDAGTAKVDAIEFGAGITASDIVVTRSGTNLILNLVGSTDRITVTNYFNADGTSSYKLEEIRFIDGSVWDVAQVKELALLNTAGNDTLTGYATDDVLNGGAGNDSLYGAAGDDQINGELGDDRLYGEDGNDLLQGAEGNDTLYGGEGNDVVYGGEGVDNLFGGNGNDILEGGTGNDNLSGEGGSDTYRFARGWGQDIINNNDVGTGKVDAIEFGVGITASDIAITRSGTNLILSLVGSTDRITVTNYFNADGTSSYKLEEIRFIDGSVWDVAQVKELALLNTASNDTLTGYATDDVLNGGAGNDSLYGAAGDDQINGELGDDRLYGEDGNDLLQGAEGNDSLYGGEGNDALYGGEGVDNLFGGNGNDILEGGTGNDNLSGEGGSDTYRFARGWGQDSINNNDAGTAKVDAIEFGAGITASDIVVTRSGTNLILSLVGSTDRITVTNYFNADGTSSYKLEEIRFIDGNVWDITTVKELALLGTAGNDSLTGYATADAINGGSGNDTLAGEGGDDTLVGGQGNDVLNGGAGNNTFVFARGDGSDIIKGFSDQTASKLNTLLFAEGIRPEDVSSYRSGSSLVLTIGTDDKVTIENFFYSAATASSSSPVQTIRFADGTEWSINASSGTTNVISGTTGKDFIVVADGSKNNVLSGGLGDDVLHGSYYADTYVFNLGDGKDTVVETSTYTSVTDTLRFGDGIVASDIQVQKVGVDLVFAHRNGADQVTVRNWFNTTASTATAVDASRVERIEFADGSSWDVNQIQSQIVVLGTAQADTLNGWAGDEALYGGDGNDLLDGGAGTNQLFGGAGDDTLKVATTAKGSLLAGGTGSDTLFGSYYADTYAFNLGDGKDTVVETSTYSNITDTLRFGEGIAASDIQVQKVGVDLVFAHRNGSDQVTVKNWFNTTASTATAVDASRVERIEFADGSSWDVNQIQSQIIVLGTTQADTLNGWAGDEALYGGDGNDLLDGGAGTNQLFGGAGDDTLKVATTAKGSLLAGGTGSDTLFGSYYADTYVFNLGDGKDTVVETSTYSNVTDTLRFGEGVAASDIQVQKVGVDLVFAHRNGADQVTVRNWFNTTASTATAVDASRVERIEFADGSSWDVNQIQGQIVVLGTAQGDTLNGWAGDESLYGGDGNDLLDGGAGTNQLFGGAGDDTLKVASTAKGNLLAGGTGSDTLYGSYYSDTYLFNAGDGHDTLIETSTYSGVTDVLRFGGDIDANELWFRQVGTDLEISTDNPADKVSIKGWYSSNAARVERVESADGKVLLDSQVQNLVDAMAAFAPPAGGSSNLTPEQKAQLEVVIAANWQ
ncbi:Ca2+-binding RTX toxin-like protein [Pseudomonas alcaligenes]|nr:Ca2+-binding RTX toxin-like protein [Pseudomonas alcaligenes]